jgi:hypothetical protein
MTCRCGFHSIIYTVKLSCRRFGACAEPKLARASIRSQVHPENDPHSAQNLLFILFQSFSGVGRPPSRPNRSSRSSSSRLCRLFLGRLLPLNARSPCSSLLPSTAISSTPFDLNAHSHALQSAVHPGPRSSRILELLTLDSFSLSLDPLTRLNVGRCLFYALE